MKHLRAQYRIVFATTGGASPIINNTSEEEVEQAL
jgi:hypothetical protein